MVNELFENGNPELGLEVMLRIFERTVKGLNIGMNQCYAFKIAPILGGKIEVDNVEVMDLSVWLHMIGQVHFQVKDLPEGTEINGFKITD